MRKIINRAISTLLATVMALQPAILHAGDIVHVKPDTARPRVDKSYNGNDILNIDTPNAAGVSHDVYTRFEAGDLILNNSATNVQTQLGGWIEGNPNLKPGQAAKLWIGEVVGGNQTLLNGILETAGPGMDVILTNEAGITCNGCGFINIPRATLSTGKPLISANGAFSGLDVVKGTVTIGAGGLNPDGRIGLGDTGRVDIISRAADIYGKMRAKSLNTVAGANTVEYNWSYDAQTGKITGVTPKAGEGAAPSVAVDVKALGGMYADKIQLIATEKGVGVTFDGTMASASDVALSSAGRLTIGKGAPEGIKAKNNVRIRADGPILLEGAITSEDGDLVDIRTRQALTFTGQAAAGSILLESAGASHIAGALAARNTLTVQSLDSTVTVAGTLAGSVVEIDGTAVENAGAVVAEAVLTITAGAGGLDNRGTLLAGSAVIDSAGDIVNRGRMSLGEATVSAAGRFDALAGSTLRGEALAIFADTVRVDGIVAATAGLSIDAGPGGLINAGSVSGNDVLLTSAGNFGNAGIISAGNTLTVEAADTIENVATLIAGNDLSLYARQILNNGGVVWANDSVTLAGNAALDPAAVVRNTNGRIEAFQGDLTIRADEVYNLGTAPSIEAAQIIKWLETGNAGPVNPVEEIAKLIDPAYLGPDGAILPAYADAYAALFSDLVSGSGVLSPAARSILKSTVTTPSGTALKPEFAGLWSEMFNKANEAGTADPAAAMRDLVDPAIFDANGAVLPQHAGAYAELWRILAAGGTVVPDGVKAILKSSSLVEETSLDPVTGQPVTTLGNTLAAGAPALWVAMNAASEAAYDIVKILFQDRFANDGRLAELVAGGNIDIVADKVENIYGNVSAGGNISVTADTVKNQALGASQFLVEVHKKPGCFTCHDGKVDFYDTFGGRIEANGNVSISGNLENITLKSSELSSADVIARLNAYIAEQQALGDPEMTGVPFAGADNFQFADSRHDDYTAPVEGNGAAIREILSHDTGAETTVDTGSPVQPVKPALTASASVDELLAAGLTQLSETNPEFTGYANFITSNYMMAEDRLAYRDDLVNNTNETILATLKRASERLEAGGLYPLDTPVQVPAADGSGFMTVYPVETPLTLDKSGALIKGNHVSISGDKLVSQDGTIAASGNLTATATEVSIKGGSITAEGELALTSLGSMEFEDTRLDALSIDLVAGKDFLGKGLAIEADDNASILAFGSVTLTGLERIFETDRAGGHHSTVDQTLSSIDVGGDLSIVSPDDIELAGVGVEAGGTISLSAGGHLLLTTVESSTESHKQSKNHSFDRSTVTSHETTLVASGDVTAVAAGDALLVGTVIDSGGKVELGAAGTIVLAASQDIETLQQTKTRKGFLSKKTTTASTTQLTNQGVSIAARDAVSAVAETGDLITAGSTFVSADGNIALSAVLGDIYAGVYTDIFASSRTTKKSYLGGLLGSTKSENSVDRFATGAQALAALELSLVSGDSLTLVGAHLSTGGTLAIDVGGNFTVQAAINSQLREYFESKIGLVTMTTITEQSYRETALLTQFLAASYAFSVVGDTSLNLYHYAGIDADNPEGLYPEELLALEGLKLIDSALADEYFYDKQVALSPAFKALVSIAVGTFIVPGLGLGGLLGLAQGTWQLAAVNAFAASVIVNGLDMAVAGDFDIGELLKDAAFAGISAGLTSGINFEFAKGSPFLKDLLPGFGQGHLTMAGLLNGALDGAIRSGLSSLVYDTDFGSAFSASLIETVVNLTLAGAQFEIGDLGLGEGSLPHMLLHGIAGCAAAAASGGSCAAGAAAAVAQSVFAGYLKDTTLSDREQRDRAQLLGALVGFVFSGGDPDNVNLAAEIALSAIANNRQLHRSEVEWINENAEAFAAWMCETTSVCGLTREQALGILTAETLDGVSDAFGVYGGPGRRAPYSAEARAFITATYTGEAYVDGQHMFGRLDKTDPEYRNTLLNAETALSNLAHYDYATAQSLWPHGQTAAMSFLHEALGDFAESPASVEAQAFVAALASSPERTKAIFAAYGAAAQVRSTDAGAASVVGLDKILRALPAEARAAAAVGFAEGATGQTGLTRHEVENAVLNGSWGPLVGFGLEEGLFADLLTKGMAIVTLPSGRKVIQDTNGRQYDTAEVARNANAGREIPPSYARNTDGSYTGPGGGKVWNTGEVDSSGNPIMRREGGGYFAINENGVQISAKSPYETTVPIHHVCTNKNCVSTANGGPWTPRFQEFFDNAGLDINSEINKIAVPGHRGPHPAEYHQYVFERLDRATSGLSPGTIQYTNAVTSTLSTIKQQAITPGHQVNAWLTTGN